MSYQNPYPAQGYRYQPYQPLQQQAAVPVPNVQPIQPTIPAQQWQQPVQPVEPMPPVPQNAQEAPAQPDGNEILAQAINRLCDLTEALYNDYRKEVQKIWTSDR